MEKVKFFVPILIWAVAGLGAATAQDRSILLLPITVKGQYRPITEERLNQEVRRGLEEAGVRVVESTESEPAPLDLKAARALAKSRAVDYVGWGSIEFSHDSKSLSSGPTGSAGSDSSPYRFQTASRVLYQVRVSSSCKLTLIPTDETRKVLLADSHLPHLHSATTSETPGSAGHRKVESRLSDWCVKTLVSHLEEVID